MTHKTYKKALGIQTGDIITTSYNTGPYEVYSIYGPRWWDEGLNWIIYPWPVINLRLTCTKDNPRYGRVTPTSNHYFSYINEIRHEDGRWFSTMGDEIFVQPPPSGHPDTQMSLFADQTAKLEPYPFQDGVDYHAGHRRVWHCEKCELDFNWEPTCRHGPPHCPRCNYIVSTQIVMAVKGEPTYRKTLGLKSK